jgi:hypothetical protein
MDWKLHNTLIDFLGNAIIASANRVNLLKLRIFRQEQTRLDEVLAIPTMREHLFILSRRTGTFVFPAKSSTAWSIAMRAVLYSPCGRKPAFPGSSYQ